MSRRRGTLRRSKGSLRAMQELDRVFNKAGRQRGNLNEGVVKEILIKLRNEEKILKFEQNWNLDRIGIDFLVCLFSGEIFAIQVKSSPKYAEKHYKKYGTTLRYKNREIRCLVLIINTGYLIDRSDLKNDIGQYISSIN